MKTYKFKIIIHATGQSFIYTCDAENYTEAKKKALRYNDLHEFDKVEDAPNDAKATKETLLELIGRGTQYEYLNLR